jgi:hypothetical protein
MNKFDCDNNNNKFKNKHNHNIYFSESLIEKNSKSKKRSNTIIKKHINTNNNNKIYFKLKTENNSNLKTNKFSISVYESESESESDNEIEIEKGKDIKKKLNKTYSINIDKIHEDKYLQKKIKLVGILESWKFRNKLKMKIKEEINKKYEINFNEIDKLNYDDKKNNNKNYYRKSNFTKIKFSNFSNFFLWKIYNFYQLEKINKQFFDPNGWKRFYFDEEKLREMYIIYDIPFEIEENSQNTQNENLIFFKNFEGEENNERFFYSGNVLFNNDFHGKGKLFFSQKKFEGNFYKKKLNGWGMITDKENYFVEIGNERIKQILYYII